MIKAIGRKELAKIIYAENLKKILLVDSYNGAPLNMEPFKFFNPFYTWDDAHFPVPNANGLHSKSIEAIWQGTKLIDGKTDYAQFNLAPYKRPSENERKFDANFSYKNTQFVYGEKIINQLEARFLIYFISYLYLIDKVVPLHLINYIKQTLKNGFAVFFVDWDENFDITNISESFSHSAILASWFNNSLEEDFLPKAQVNLSEEYFHSFKENFYNSVNRYGIKNDSK